MINKILNKTLNTYLLFSVVIILILAATRIDSKYDVHDEVSFFAYVVNIFTILSYFLLLKFTLGLKSSAYNSKNLMIIVFFYSIIFVVIFKWLFYLYNGTYFEFHTSDSTFYHTLALKISALSFFDGLSWLKKNISFEEWGMSFYITTLYRIIPSILFVNFINIVLGAISASMLFKMASVFFERKAAFISVLVFSCASFMLYFHASGLKESFFCFIVIGFFYYSYAYFYKRNLKLFVAIVLFGIFIFFLRPILLAFAIAALLFWIFPKIAKNPFYLLSMLVIIVVSVIIFPDIQTQANSFFPSTAAIIASHSQVTEKAGSVQYSYFLSLFSALLGPMPTFIFKNKEGTFLYSTGLLLRVILSYYFFMGLLIIYKTKKTIMYPIVAFTLFEIVSLAAILESFELRLNMPHFPFLYIISFYGIFMKSKELYYKKYKFEKIYLFAVFVIVLAWNFR